jgi:FKBP-type peptidyl-prolyl cis-trans isomerase SlpA
MTMVVQPGSRVTLHYTLSFRDGEVVDSTQAGSPAQVVIGGGDLFEPLEKRLIGLAAGEHREFAIDALESIALSASDVVQNFPRDEFPPDLELQPGQIVAFSTPNDDELPGRVVAVSEYEVSVDFSHPLAGRDLIFDVEILSIDAPA